MRLFVGGSNGLVLYEDDDVTRVAGDPVCCLARAGSRSVAGTEAGSILAFAGSGEVSVVSKDLGTCVSALTALPGGGLLAGTMPAGVWRSKDGGHTWKELPGAAAAPGCEAWTSPGHFPAVSSIAVHPKDRRTVYFGVEVGGLYRSRDGGRTWSGLGIPAADVHAVQVSPARGERLYVTTGCGVGVCGAFCSDDEGFHWRPMGTANRRQYAMGLAAHSAEPDRVIVSAAAGPPPWTGKGGARCDVYLSTDAGRRFRTVVEGLEGGVRRKALVINPRVPSEVVFGTSTGELWYSSDGGESFDPVADGFGDVHAVTFA